MLWVSAQGRRLQLTPQSGHFPGRAGTRPTDPWASVEFATSVRLPSFKHAGPNRRGTVHESCRLRPRLWLEDMLPVVLARTQSRKGATPSRASEGSRNGTLVRRALNGPSAAS